MSGDFWSRRKAAVEKEALVEEAAVRADQAAAADAVLAERPDEELLAEANLPEPEALETPEAVREFMASALPQRLKSRALRRLWTLNPVLANIDGLVEYGEDYTDAATVIENLQTTYQVGKGMLKHVEEMAAQAEAKAEELAGDNTQDAADEVEESVAEAEEVEEPVLDDPAPVLVAEVSEGNAVLPGRRRMQFQFEDSV